MCASTLSTNPQLCTYKILNPLAENSDKEICSLTCRSYSVIIRGRGQRATAAIYGEKQRIIDKQRIIGM